MTSYLYSRVSTDEQTVENQKLAAKTAGYAVDREFSDEAVSGGTKANDREQFTLMKAEMKSGDVLVIGDISRLGRSTIDVLNNLEYFEKNKIKVCVLNYGNLDITSDMGKVIVTMAAAFAQLERADLKRKTKQGMERTRAQGTKLGTPLIITPEVLSMAAKDRKEGVLINKICEKYKLSKSTLQRNLNRWGDNLSAYAEEYAAREKQYALLSLRNVETAC